MSGQSCFPASDIDRSWGGVGGSGGMSLTSARHTEPQPRQGPYVAALDCAGSMAFLGHNQVIFFFF